MHALCLLAFVSLMACGRSSSSARPMHVDSSATPALDSLAAAYRVWLPQVQDDSGFVDSEHCDSLTFSGLLAAAGADVDLGDAEVRPGEWWRRPINLPECFATGASRSTVSRDGLLSVLWAAWSIGGDEGREAVQRLWSYALAHGGRMGDGRLGGADALLNENLWALLAATLDALGGDPGAARALAPFWGPGAVGFEARLQVDQILLWGELRGWLPPSGFDALRAQAERQPWNPHFVAAMVVWGGWAPAEVESRLASEEGLRLWPRDRLPTSEDRCSPWVVERDAWDPSWLPCPQEKAAPGNPPNADEFSASGPRVHSGGELLFIQRVLRGPLQGVTP